MDIEEIISSLQYNYAFCKEICFLFPSVENVIKIYKGNPNNNIIKEKLVRDLEKLKEDSNFLELLESNLINNSNPVDIRGNVYKIKATSSDYKKFMKHVRDNNWKYNTFSVTKSDDYWLLFFG